MADQLNGAWDLLSAIALIQERLRALRPFIWERTHLATAEHTQITRAEVNGSAWRPTDDGDHIAVEVSVETRYRDGRYVTSYLEIVAKPHEWQVKPYIGFMDRTERVLWEGPTSRPHDLPGFLEAIDAATKNLVNATVRLDFDKVAASPAAS